jgi:hypothetical protein
VGKTFRLDIARGEGQQKTMSNDEMSTKPTIETVIERVNAWGERLAGGQEELRADLNAGLHRVSRKIEILNDNILTVQADIRDLVVRMEKLESESVAPK